MATHLTRVLPNDLGDPVLNTWILWWSAHAVPLTRAWWDGPMFFPTRGAMAFSETLLGLSIVASPLQWIGLSPVTAYNLLFLLSFPLSAFAAYLLAWALTRRVGPSFVAGAMYGYAMFRFAHLGHIQILWSWWMPLALLGLHHWIAGGEGPAGVPNAVRRVGVGAPARVLTDRRASGLILFGLAWLGESLSNGYYFLYFSVIVGLWLAWFTPWRGDAWRKLVPVLVTWAAVAVCMVPVLLTYMRVQQEQKFGRSFQEIAGNSADLADFFSLSSTPRFAAEQDEQVERQVGFGVVPTLALLVGIAVVLIGLRTPALPTPGPPSPAPTSLGSTRRSPDRFALAFYILATLVAMLLALGPQPRVGGVEFLPSGPYAWLMARVPGFTGVRAPARFTLIAVLCLAIATALLLARVRLASVSRERLLFGAIALAALLETWPRPIPMMPLPPLIDRHVLTPNAAVLELPVGENQEWLAVYRAMFHGHPLVNGYSGYTPKSYDDLRGCLAVKNPGCLTRLRHAGPLDILIDRQNDGGGAWELFISQLPDAQFRYRTRQFIVFHLPALAGQSVPSAALPPAFQLQSALMRDELN